ncbi:hypothetical protein TNCV_1315171 [Trichonephila clavipes]|uniref:Uncharacterized protein n=1 Tax=Trichonephila clavipes TaxID=2585209 RepID=A0A8X6SX17_TRICX|nr:hypothetical protein TNCV_1315171 [Trichonephila clavipes]
MGCILAIQLLQTRQVPKCEIHFLVGPSSGGPGYQIWTLELILIQALSLDDNYCRDFNFAENTRAKRMGSLTCHLLRFSHPENLSTPAGIESATLSQHHTYIFGATFWTNLSSYLRVKGCRKQNDML